MRALVLVLVIGCAAEKSAESPGSASPIRTADKTSSRGGGGIVEDPCAGGQVTGMNGHAGSGATVGAPPPIVEEAPPVSGGLDRALIKRTVQAQSGAIKKCYDESLRRDAPAGQLKVSVTFTIAADGTVPKADATGGPQPFMDCLGAVFRKLKFPASAAAVEIRYPLDFAGG